MSNKCFARSLRALCAGLSIMSTGVAETTLTGDHAVRLDSGTPGDTGSLTVDGDFHVGGNADFGTTGSSMAAIKLLYTEDGTTYTQTVLAERALVEFLWKHNAVGTETLKMSLGSDNVLTLHNAAGDPAIVLDPDQTSPSIQVYGQEVLVQGTGSDAYLTQDDSDQRYLPLASSLSLFGGSAIHDGALVAGDGNVSTANGQVLVGSNALANGDTALAIGNGTTGAPSNAWSVTAAGDASVGQDLFVARHTEVGGNTTLQGETTINADTTVNGVLRVPASGNISMGAFYDFDEDAQAFFERMTVEGVILDIQTREVVSQFVEILKTQPSEQDSLWNKLHCLWIFVGNTGNTCKLDLKGAYDITWSNEGSIIFDANGIRRDGAGHGDTGFNPYTSADDSDFGMTVSFSRPTSGGNRYVIGLNVNNEHNFYAMRFDAGAFYQVEAGRLNWDGRFPGSFSGGGVVTMSIHDSNLWILRDGVELHHVDGYSVFNTFPNRTAWLLRVNSAVAQDWDFGDGTVHFAAIHKGMNDQEIIAFQAAISQLQSDLGR